MVVVLVRGVGDVGSAVAHALFLAGYAVVIHDEPTPTITRRGMAFADALFEGVAQLEAVDAVRVDGLDDIQDRLIAHRAIPVTVANLEAVLRVVGADVVVDARMRKRAHPDVQRGLAKLTIGLGPNFVAGVTTDLVVETSWGERLGQVTNHGATMPLAGEPRPLGGHARDRYVYAPVDGVFRTGFQIGDPVCRGELVANVGAAPVAAPLDGVLRGLTRDGVVVTAGTKVLEVDPRGSGCQVRGIGERPHQIAEGVLGAVRAWLGTP